MDMNDAFEVKFLQSYTQRFLKTIRLCINRKTETQEQWAQLSADGVTPWINSLLWHFSLNAVNKFLDSAIRQIKNPQSFNLPYLVSFSKDPDLLSQWIKYADSGSGVCIGFNVARLKELMAQWNEQHANAAVSLDLYAVQYGRIPARDFVLDQFTQTTAALENDSQHLQGEDLDALIEKEAQDFVNGIMDDGCLYKDEGFREELEYRIAASGIKLVEEKYLEPPAGLLDFACVNNRIKTHLNLDLSPLWPAGIIESVTMGPAFNGNQLDFAYFIRTLIGSEVPIKTSAIPFRRLQ